MKAETAVFTAYEDHVGIDAAEPEKNLMRAVLRTAMEDISKGGPPSRDARNYLLSQDDSYLFSFSSVCNHLNLCRRTILILCGLVEEQNKKRKGDSDSQVTNRENLAA